jgi:hypothetical protein
LVGHFFSIATGPSSSIKALATTQMFCALTQCGFGSDGIVPVICLARLAPSPAGGVFPGISLCFAAANQFDQLGSDRVPRQD